MYKFPHPTYVYPTRKNRNIVGLYGRQSNDCLPFWSLINCCGVDGDNVYLHVSLHSPQSASTAARSLSGYIGRPISKDNPYFKDSDKYRCICFASARRLINGACRPLAKKESENVISVLVQGVRYAIPPTIEGYFWLYSLYNRFHPVCNGGGQHYW